MSASPILEEFSGSASGRLIGELANYEANSVPPAFTARTEGRPQRSLAVYTASAGFEYVEELEHLCARAVEPNLFFNPRFLAPAMPRLDDKDVRLAVIRDGNEFRSRLRLLVPYTIERPANPFGVSVLRTWSSPFGPLGTPLVDRDDPAGVLADFFDILSRPHLRLPKVFVMPEVRLDGPFAALVNGLAESRGLPLETVGRFERSHIVSELEGDAYLKQAMSTHRLKEMRRLKRRLGERGRLEYRVARQQEEVRLAVESFLALEASGWKGRRRSAMAVDRFRAAFVREAAQRLSERDLCRVHEFILDGRVIASLVVFVEAGVAYTWKTAYDEDFAAWSPGMLLMGEVTRNHLDDPNIEVTDSCAAPNHPVVDHLWSEKRPLGTLVIGLTPDAGRHTRQAAAQMQLQRNTMNMSRILRQRVRKAFNRKD